MFKVNFLFSMDVVAMYPSVQREPALREMEDQLSKDPELKERRTKWKPEQIKRLAEVCFETHFVFINNGKTYTQYDGTPIGKSISGPACDLLMGALERDYILMRRNKWKPDFWVRIKDDTPQPMAPLKRGV